MGSIYKTKSLPRRGYRTQPRVSTLGIVLPRATRPEGGARSNVLTRRKRGPMVQLSHVPIAHGFRGQQMRVNKQWSRSAMCE